VSTWTAASQKARRDRARAAGLCIQCCKVPHLPDRVRCARCLAWSTSYATTKTVRGSTAHVDPDEFCVECQAAKFHRVGCVASRTNEIEQGGQ
jgi:hypothetical protein